MYEKNVQRNTIESCSCTEISVIKCFFFKAMKVNPKIKRSKCLGISIFIKNTCTPAL